MLKNENINKKKILEELMAIKDWRHPFLFTENKSVSLERPELGPWNKWRSMV